MLQIWYIITFIRGTNLRYQFKKKIIKSQKSRSKPKICPFEQDCRSFWADFDKTFFCIALHKNLEIKCNSPVVPFHGILPSTATIKRFQFLRPFNWKKICFALELNWTPKISVEWNWFLETCLVTFMNKGKICWN